MIGLSFFPKQSFLHWGRSAAKIDREHSNSLRIQLFPQTIGDRSQGVFCGGILTCFGPLCNSPALELTKTICPRDVVNSGSRRFVSR